MADDYEVGYRKPPRHSQFRKGQSGNPKGRPKGTQNLRTDFLEELSERMTIREGSREVTLSKQRVLMKSLMSGALKGSPAAIKSVLELAFRFAELSEEEPRDAAALTADEREVVDLLLQRLEGGTAGDQPAVSKDEGGDGESV
jgi:hypothetical protein